MFTENELIRILKLLCHKNPYLAFVTQSLNLEITDVISTAAVSFAKNEFMLLISSKFFATLSLPQQIGVVVHELYHLLLYHLVIGRDMPDRNLANIALDLEVNQHVLENPEFELPEGAILLNDFIKKYPQLNLPPFAGAAHYYKELQKLQTCNEVGYDHGFLDDDSTGSASAEALTNHLNGLLERINSTYNGSIPGKIKEILMSFKQKPKDIPWNILLRRVLQGSDQVYTKRSRLKVNNFSEDRPAMKVGFKSRILVAIDTSGSVSNRELQTFMGEIYHLWKFGYTVDVFPVDTELYPPTVYKGQSEIAIHGRGGTYFTPVIEFFNANRNKYNIMFYFTDGYAETPPPTINPMVWIITPDGSTSAPEAQTGNRKIIKLNNLISS